MYVRLKKCIALLCCCGFAAALLTACTDLKVYRVKTDAQSEDLNGVIPYVLPKKTLFVSVTYVLTGCVTTSQDALKLDADTTIELVVANEPDESERYTIPYVALRSWLKETNITVESHGNKTLKSFNGTINDQAASVITATIGTAIKLGAVVAAATAPPKHEFCDYTTRASLAEVANYKKLISELVAKPKAKEKAATSGTEKGGPTSADSAPSQDDAKISIFQAKMDKVVREKLTTKVALTWSPSSSELRSRYVGHDAAVRVLKPDYALTNWLTVEGRQWLATHNDTKQNINIVVDVPAWAHPQKTSDPINGAAGFVVRDPALGTVFVCKGQCPIPQEGLMSVDNVVVTSAAAFPQLGRRVILPLHNSLGQNSVLDLSMSEDGVITKVGAHSTGSAASGITELGKNAEAEKAQIDARNKAKADAQTAAQNKPHDDNKRLAECLEAQKKILENGGTPIGSCQ